MNTIRTNKTFEEVQKESKEKTDNEEIYKFTSVIDPLVNNSPSIQWIDEMGRKGLDFEIHMDMYYLYKVLPDHS